MKTYLVDGTNMSRRGSYDPRFPEMEQRRCEEVVDLAARLAESLGGRGSVEVLFDGPFRDVGDAGAAVLRFSGEREADDLILGTVRSLRLQNRGVVVVTEDGSLRAEVEEEGGRVLGFGEFQRVCRR